MSHKLGIVKNTNQAYHHGPGISRSQIMEFRKTPRHFYERFINKSMSPKKETPALILGQAVHTAVLEPELFFNEFAMKPDWDARTKEGKLIRDAFLAESIGKKVISQEEYEKICKMAESLNPYTNNMLLNSKIEHSIYWMGLPNILCKARPDIMQEHFIADIKTASDASKKSFYYAVQDYGYHIQAAMIQEAIYLTTAKFITDFVFLVVETIEPYLVATYMLSEEMIAKGRSEYLTHLTTYKNCLENNEWPSYEPDVI